jgi:hypothetical protein
VLAKVFLVLDGEWEDVAAVDAREGDVGGHAEKLAQNTLRGNATKTKPSILSWQVTAPSNCHLLPPLMWF